MLLLVLAWGCSGSDAEGRADSARPSGQASAQTSWLWVVDPLFDSALKGKLGGCGRACLSGQLTRTVADKLAR